MRSNYRPSDAAIDTALKQYHGKVYQVPPLYAAIKIDGKRAYKLARDEKGNGRVVKLAARQIYIESFRRLFSNATHAKFLWLAAKGPISGL